MMGLSTGAWTFGSLALILSVVALGFALWPLRRGSVHAADAPLTRKDQNIRLYRERLAEVEHAVRLGEMTAGEAKVQEEEAARHLLSDARAEPADGGQAKAGGAWLYALAAVAVPLCAVLLYLQGEGWRLHGADGQSPPWDFIIHRAQARLEKNPQDHDTRAFLARSYRALEKYDEAAREYAELNVRMTPPNPDFLVEEGEMRAMREEGSLQGRTSELFDHALRINPAHGRALWYAGLAALQRQDNEAAVGHWQILARQELPENFRHVLERQLKRLGAEVPATATIPTETAATAPVIRVKVEVAPGLVTDLPPSTTVFVYAKAQKGPGMPVAVSRMTLAELPAEIVLSDAMSMAGGPALSSLAHWAVYARIAPAGTAVAKQGDPYGVVELDTATALKSTLLTIDSRWQE